MSQTSGVPAAETNFIRQLSIPASDVVFDKVGGTHASVPSKQAQRKQHARINRLSGLSLCSSVAIGKTALADDGQTLYVGLDGAAAVRRCDLNTQTPGLQFSLGNASTNGPLLAAILR